QQPAAAGQPALPGSAIPADAVKPQSLAATLLGRAPLTPASELPNLGPNTQAATLSSAARVLTSILSATQGQTAQVALVGKTALFGNSAPDTADLAQKLQDTISKSGLFYESHVAEWAKGERSLPDLMREPQMQRLLQQQQAADAPLSRLAGNNNGPDLSAAQMVNQQLHTQEQGRVLWNGQAWPGQPMQWEVQRDQREGGRGGGDERQDPVWRSGVRFRLPLLGAVSAAVTLVGEQVHIQVQTGTGDSAVTLRAWAGELESALAAAGAPLASLTIAAEQPTEAGHDG
ncbi:flagellar hook-length control protein FliK, partial [Duganella callida]